MGLLSDLRGWFGFERKMSPDSERIWRELYGTAAASSGVQVTWQRALEIATFFACLRVMGHGMAQVPFRLMRRLENGDSQPAKDTELFDVVTSRPNDWMTSFELRELIAWHRGALGNAFVFKNVVAGRVVELIPLEPQRVTVEQLSDFRLVYTYATRDGVRQTFPQESIWHIRGPSWNGWMGQETVKLMREALGLTIAIERSQGSLHQNGIQTNGAWSVDQKLSDEQYKQLTAWIKKHYGEADKKGLPLILDNGAKWQSITMSMVDAQTLESRRLQIEEVCRASGVMPIMVGHSDKTATYASVEQMLLAHVVHSLAPEYARIEQSADANLLTPTQRRQGYYFKFFAQALMRGAAKDRGEFYAKGLQSWLLPNEVRQLEDMNAIPGLDEEHRARLAAMAGRKDPAAASDKTDPPADPAPQE